MAQQLPLERDPDPWLALKLDRSLPLDYDMRDALIRDIRSKSRQFLYPFIRVLALFLMLIIQVYRVINPNKLTSSKILHYFIYLGMKYLLSPDANFLILRHFHVGSDILKFIGLNVPGAPLPTHALRPEKMEDIKKDLFLIHDLNLYNFIIDLNMYLKDKKQKITEQASINYSSISEEPFSLPLFRNGWSNFLDMSSAIEIYTPFFHLFLSDSDFWRSTNSLQLDEILAIYISTIIGEKSLIGLVNNRHPLIPDTTLLAGNRLILHGFSAEIIHATLRQKKRLEILNKKKD